MGGESLKFLGGELVDDLSGLSWKLDLDRVGRGDGASGVGLNLDEPWGLLQGKARHAPVSEHGSPEPSAGPVQAESCQPAW